MSKLAKVILPILLLFFLAQPVLAQDNVFPVRLPALFTEKELINNYSDQQTRSGTESLSSRVNLYFFWGDGCSHCAKEKVFLQQLEKENRNIKLYSFEVYKSSQNRKLFSEIGRELQIDTSGVPLLIVGEKHFVGFYNAQTTGVKIKQAVNDYLKHGCVDLAGELLGIKPEPSSKEPGQEECEPVQGIPNKISLPFLGEINPSNFSLPILTIVLAAIDGFNPCAMWVLLFLINLLLGIESRKKMWILGSAFIISSAAVYFMFLAAWLNIVLFMGLVTWLRVIIALVAFTSGGYYLHEFYINRPGCKVTSSAKRKIVFEKLRRIVLEEKFFLALAGIIILAAIVNLVELLCSAGIPAVYVPILTLSNLPVWQYYFYLILYIFVFLLDDLLIFIVAMATLRMKAISSRFTRWSGLVGGIIMVLIGILLLFKPGWLMFG